MMQSNYFHLPISLSSFAVGLTVLIAAWSDWMTWRIPNALVAGSAAAAMVIAIFAANSMGIASCVVGGVVGLTIFLPIYILKGMAAGDVKLIGAIGMHVGSELIIEIALASALIGGIWALVLMDLRKGSGPVSWLSFMCNRKLGSLGNSPPSEIKSQKTSHKRYDMIPYGVVIAIGTVTTLTLRA